MIWPSLMLKTVTALSIMIIKSDIINFSSKTKIGLSLNVVFGPISTEVAQVSKRGFEIGLCYSKL